MAPILKIYLFGLTLLLNVVSLLTSFVYYRKYYVRMKTEHASEWLDLMNRDEAIAFLGEWIRWPFGSIYLIQSFVRPTPDFGDAQLRVFKRRGVLAGYVFACSFLVFLVEVGYVLPK